jgi:hypothetical protein
MSERIQTRQTVPMEKRQLRIVKKAPPPAIGVCERCNARFKSALDYPFADIQVQFDAHKCQSLNSDRESSNTGNPIN